MQFYLIVLELPIRFSILFGDDLNVLATNYRNWLQFGACIGLAFPVYVTTTLQMALALSAMQSCGRVYFYLNM